MGAKREDTKPHSPHLQHALKHLHESEYGGTHATNASLAGATGLSLERAAELAGELSGAGLAVSSAAGLQLTEAGREQARRIVRAHRIYETYLAHQTGVTSDKWHRHADHAEHRLSARDVDALADRLGRPRYDPHGDPIPTREGTLPPRRGEPLDAASAGSNVVVTHLEDEPEGFYRRAAALGIVAGARLHLIARTPGLLRLRIEDRECDLPLDVAGAIQVEPCAPPPPMRALSSLRTGEAAKVVGLSPSIIGGERRRLLDLGLVPGTLVERDFDSMLGSPTAYRVRGATIALRKEQSDRIFVEA
ncbi:MAG: metal-dependent transcriptional regulator [Chthoniobacterales bacterium]|nr:metal-dependent transcriptional regulator [Chthoniobacterales bacterium]